VASDVGFVEYVCDNQLFLKPTEAGKVLLDGVKEAPLYPGARLYYLIDAQLDDAEAATAIARATADALSMPKVKATTTFQTGSSKPGAGSTGWKKPG
jgi:TfoX/Sxy family transcriptional regulator of competence genes